MKHHLLLITLLLSGCGAGDGTGLDQFGQPISDTPSEPEVPQPDASKFTRIQQEIFTPICSVCHSGSGAPLGLVLDNLEQSAANLINMDSATNSSFKRVLAGDADNSFLYMKVSGNPVAGNQMPLGQTPLSADAQQLIKDWINEGAPIPTEISNFTLAAKSQNNALAMTIDLTFSHELNIDTVSDLMITADSGQVLSSGQYHLSQPDKQHLQLTIPKQPGLGDKITININNPSINNVLSTSGLWLDGDRDGQQGGEFRYEINL
jgi:hypothetical protein